jgi:hypothetical protein
VEAGGGGGGGGSMVELLVLQANLTRESYGAGGQYQQTTTPSTPSVSVGGGDKLQIRMLE